MSSEVLLNKERDFLELNKELDEKVKSLMHEVDTIISRQENVIRKPRHFSHNAARRSLIKLEEFEDVSSASDEDESNSMNDIQELAECRSDVREKTSEDYYDDSSVVKGEERCMKKSKRSTNQTIIRFLKAQVVKLQTDLQAAQNETKKKNERCKELELEVKRQEEKREKLHGQITTHKETIIKAEVLNSELQAKIQTQNTEISSLKKEIEGLKKDFKSLNQLTSNNEIRLNRSLEENEKLRSCLKISQNEERELREQVRKTQEEKRLALKNSEKQRTEIFQAFKKQMQLVDNLKKQRAYLEASKEIQFVEEDFTRLLEWKPDKI